MDDMLDFLGIVAICAVVAAILFAGLAFAGDLFSARACSNWATTTGKHSEYRHFDGCYVQTEKGMMRWDEYKTWLTASALAK